MGKILGVDGNSIMNRAFYGIMGRNIMKTTDGIYTNAIYGFLAILNKTILDYNPDYICVAFDLKAPTFRHKKYDEYKGTRKPMPEELVMQMPLIKDILKAMNIKILEQEGYEADDILGTVSKDFEKSKDNVLLLTGDRDYLQLVSKSTTVRIPTTKQGQTEYTDYTPETVKEKYNIEPIEFIEIKGLMGDSSDNIPGIPGVGEKTAFLLIEKYHNLDNIYNELDNNKDCKDIKGKLREKVEQNKELAYLSKDLGTIYREVPLGLSKEDYKKQDYNNDELYNLFVKLQFRNYIEKFGLVKPSGDVASKANEFEDKEYEIKDIEDFLKVANKSKSPITVSYYFGSKGSVQVYYDEAIYYKKDPSIAELKNFFENDKIIKIGYDIKTDYVRLREKGIVPCAFNSDIKIASYILNPTKNNFRLDDIVLEELGLLLNSQKENTQLSLLAEGTSDAEDDKIEKKYPAYIFACMEKLAVKLKAKDEYKLFSEIEMPLRIVLAKMQYAGVLVDKNTLEKYQDTLSKKVNELHDEVIKLAGEDFNINSPKQLGVILFEKLHLPIIKKTKSGYSTDAEVLEKLEDEHPIINKILEYRTISKLKSTYADGLLPLIKDDGRIHASFNQTITATGRLSCSDPNLQNIPVRTELGREFRKIFVAPKGYKLIDADYSQIELRILAHISDDENMIKAFNEGEDIHRITASQVFEVPLDEVTKEMRSDAKAVNFGIVYGISDFGLGANIGISRYKARIYIEKYFTKYPKIKAFMDNAVKECREKGYAVTMWGRKRDVPEINAKNYNVRQAAERIAMNTPIQGSAADIIKIAMVNVDKELEKQKLSARLILQVHDELIIECPDNEIEIVKEILTKKMQEAGKLKVPLTAEAQVGETWFDAH
jgi:DNA polymerase-1